MLFFNNPVDVFIFDYSWICLVYKDYFIPIVVSILRNQLAQRGFGFEPAENYGVANFLNPIKLMVSAADVNGDGVVDLALANGSGDSVMVMLNELIAGAHRVSLDGVATVAGLDFGLQPQNAMPTIDAISRSASDDIS